MQASILEIYGNKIFDLLSNENSNFLTQMHIQHDRDSTIVKGLTYVNVCGVADAKLLLENAVKKKVRYDCMSLVCLFFLLILYNLIYNNFWKILFIILLVYMYV